MEPLAIEDLMTAAEISSGDERRAATLAERFVATLDREFEKRKTARSLGLTRDDFARGVCRAAARVFLASTPLAATAAIDPYVERIAAEEDFALAVLLQRAVPEAWDHFREHWSGELRGFFLSGGRRAVEATALADEVILELRRPVSRTGESPIARYHGSSSLTTWLFVYVRRSFGGGVGGILTRTSAFPILDLSESSDESSVDDDRLEKFLASEVEAALAACDEVDRRELVLTACGARAGTLLNMARADGRTPEGLAEHLAKNVERIFKSVIGGVAGHMGTMRADTEHRLLKRAARRRAKHLSDILPKKSSEGRA